MTDTNLIELRAKAEAATPGPWLIGNSQMFGPHAITRDAEGLGTIQDVWICDADAEHSNAEYIAAVSPDVVLALLDALEASNARAENAERERANLEVQTKNWMREIDALAARLASAEAVIAEVKATLDNTDDTFVTVADGPHVPIYLVRAALSQYKPTATKGTPA